jgi:hypothetical protein
MFDDIQYRLLTTPLEIVFEDFIDKDGLIDEDHYVFYHPLIASMGFETVIVVHDDSNTGGGDSRFIFKHGDFYGLLIFGWGSCSGCDRLQACRTVGELEDLRKFLFDSIKWGSASELLTYVREHDWKGDWTWHRPETHKFIKLADEYLNNQL